MRLKARIKGFSEREMGTVNYPVHFDVNIEGEDITGEQVAQLHEMLLSGLLMDISISSIIGTKRIPKEKEKVKKAEEQMIELAKKLKQKNAFHLEEDKENDK